MAAMGALDDLRQGTGQTPNILGFHGHERDVSLVIVKHDVSCWTMLASARRNTTEPVSTLRQG